LVWFSKLLGIDKFLAKVNLGTNQTQM